MRSVRENVDSHLSSGVATQRIGPPSDISDRDFIVKTGDSGGLPAWVSANRRNVQHSQGMAMLAPLVLNTGCRLRIVAVVRRFR
jgi:hypothetical protein